MINSLNPQVYNRTVPTVLLFLFFVIEILDISGLATGSRPPRIISIVIKYVCYSLNIIVFVKFNYAMFHKYFSGSFHNLLRDGLSVIQSEDRVSFLMSLMTTLSVTGQALLPLCGPGGIFFVEDSNPAYISMYCILTTIFSVLTTMIPSRIIMHRSYTLRNELENRKVFVRHISHEVRTPLNAAVIALKLLQSAVGERKSEEEILQLVSDAQDSCSIAVEILSDILDYEKAGDALMTIEPRLQCPLEFLDVTIKPFINSAAAKHIQLIYQRQEMEAIVRSGWEVNIDEIKMAQVLRNFISNAIKFSPVMGIVQISASLVTDHDLKFIRIDVIDNGPGISDEDQRKVSQNRFFDAAYLFRCLSR